MPRFVLLRHECPPNFAKPSHWDFMLEQNEVLWTWELRELPVNWQRVLGHASEVNEPSAACEISALRLPDHRLAYLEFKGPLSGTRGTVTRCDGGEFELLEQRPEKLEIRLAGGKIRGLMQLTSPAVDENWLLLVGRG